MYVWIKKKNNNKKPKQTKSNKLTLLSSCQSILIYGLWSLFNAEKFSAVLYSAIFLLNLIVFYYLLLCVVSASCNLGRGLCHYLCLQCTSHQTLYPFLQGSTQVTPLPWNLFWSPNGCTTFSNYTKLSLKPGWCLLFLCISQGPQQSVQDTGNLWDFDWSI